MNTELEQALRDSGAGLTLTTPVETIIAGGNRLRWRRRRAVGAGVAGVLALAAVTGAALLPSRSGLVPSAVAAFSGPATNLTPDQLDAVTDACITGFREVLGDSGLQQANGPLWDISPDAAPVAAELRGNVVQTYFAEGEEAGTCTLRAEADGTFNVRSQGVAPHQELARGDHLKMQGITTADEGAMGGGLSELAAVAQVSAAVERVELVIGDETVTGYLSDGVAFFWPSDGHTSEEVDDASFQAVDAAGGVLEEGRFDGTRG